MKIELVTWNDAGSNEADLSWAATGEEGEDEDIVIRSVGWIVKETAKYLTLAMDLSDDGQTHSRSRIPIGMIVGREILFEDKKKPA